MTTDWPRRPSRPRHLSAGDRVAVVTPSWGGPAAFPRRYEAGLEQLKALFQVDVVEMPHARAPAEWLHANPKARADDLMMAFADPAIDAIVASIGGDDAERLIPFIDLEVVTRNPKVFLGYSNTTIISFGCLKAGLVSFYGPSIMSGFAENAGPFDYMISSLRKTLFSPSPVGVVEPNQSGWTVEHLPWADPDLQSRRRSVQPSTGPRLVRGQGTACGHLVGGCADTMESLKGTEWWPPLEYWHGAILFYETSENAPPPATVARWLRNLGVQGILSAINGILFARPGGRIRQHEDTAYDRAILGVLDEFGLNTLPVLTNLDFGHTDPIFTLPVGAKAEINCDRSGLSFVEAATT